MFKKKLSLKPCTFTYFNNVHNKSDIDYVMCMVYLLMTSCGLPAPNC